MASLSLAAEGFQDFVRQRIEKRIGNHEFPLGCADPRLTDLLAEGSDFRHWLIAIAKHQRLAGPQFGQIARQIGLGIVDIDSFQDYIMN